MLGKSVNFCQYFKGIAWHFGEMCLFPLLSRVNHIRWKINTTLVSVKWIIKWVSSQLHSSSWLTKLSQLYRLGHIHFPPLLGLYLWFERLIVSLFPSLVVLWDQGPCELPSPLLSVGERPGWWQGEMPLCPARPRRVSQLHSALFHAAGWGESNFSISLTCTHNNTTQFYCLKCIYSIWYDVFIGIWYKQWWKNLYLDPLLKKKEVASRSLSE